MGIRQNVGCKIMPIVASDVADARLAWQADAPGVNLASFLHTVNEALVRRDWQPAQIPELDKKALQGMHELLQPDRASQP